jgi:hypothetical protein
MLGTLSTCLTIDAYGPIADNAGGIAEMSHMGEEVRERTDALDAAGNTTAAIGKGFAIGSAALVSLALFGSFVTQAHLEMADASLLDNKTIMGLLVGGALHLTQRWLIMHAADTRRAAMLPYWFSAMTVKAVGKAALRMVEEVRHPCLCVSCVRAKLSCSLLAAAGAPPVPHHPRPDGGHRAPQLRALHRHLHQVVAARDDRARRARHAVAHRMRRALRHAHAGRLAGGRACERRAGGHQVRMPDAC